jgi:flavin reductase (DIM6/NTAB) family NADH-FMN oxidoreductase RutF
MSEQHVPFVRLDAGAAPEATVSDAALRPYRAALGRFATGVAVCTTIQRGVPVGLTINSFTSLSLRPSLVAWALDRRSASLEAFTGANRHAISVLAAEQGDLARRFSTSPADRFVGLDLPTDGTGVPWIPGALAVFSCRLIRDIDVGDHVLLVAEVDTYLARSGQPLVFSAGTFGTFASGRTL